MIGVLALQGGYQQHLKALHALGAEARLVRVAEELDLCDGLVIPGGESTTMSWLLRQRNLLESLRLYSANHPVFGTCAGLIIMANDGVDARVSQLGLLDVTIERNAYGAQVDSFEAAVHLTQDDDLFQGIFIRAPMIKSCGSDVEVLGTCRGMPALVRQGRFLAATFHPELCKDWRVHQIFVDEVTGVSYQSHEETSQLVP